ncbi:MAG TPA: GrpB family protein [Edaphobacter sp.]|jgi:GrpB-like predicted nucleotidyltransferase (UPF0157 family)|nr:GrpB family protein [Edaphobacter sp.]
MDEVRLAEYDPGWPKLYAAEAERLMAVLSAGLVLSIEHFGSTAVPGLMAKPIIDILVEVRSVQEARKIAIQPLEAIGYAFWSDNPRRDRMFFVKGLPPAAPHRTHHVHIVESGTEMREQLLFRDYLRSHLDEVLRYGNLKSELMAKFRNDREAYTAAKSAYVKEVLAKCVS